MLQIRIGKLAKRPFKRGRRSRSAIRKNFPITLCLDNDYRLQTLITIKGNPFKATVDTGATHSCIRFDIVEQLQVPLVATGFHTLYLADKTRVQVEGCVNLWFVLHGVVYRHDFLILKSSLDPIIIGMNFIHQTGSELRIIPRQGQTANSNAQILQNYSCISSLQTTPDNSLEEDEQSQQIIQNFLNEQLPRFESISGYSEITEHTIVMKHSQPLRQRYYPRNPAMQKVIDEHIDELLKE